MKFLVAVVTLLIALSGAAWFALGPYMFSGLAAPLTGNTDISSWQQTQAVTTPLGPVVGLEHDKGVAFLGLPYAKPPVESLRFMPPVAIEPWQETFSATKFPNRCMQNDLAPIIIEPNSFEMSEDCLYLNIYTSLTDSKERTVMFWIHGGAFTAGTGNGYVGTQLAAQGDVVVVSINYRLGLMGFLDLSGYGEAYAGSASNGIRDQIQALRWVRDNIRAYGGDPENVTIFGESAGATSVTSIIAAPSANGLYHRAIVHSGVPVFAPPVDFRDQLAGILGIQKDQLVSTLEVMSTTEISDLLSNNLQGQFGGTIDGAVVTRSNYQAIQESTVPIIVGSNKNEGTLFTLLTPALAHGIIGPTIGELVAGKELVDAYLSSLKEDYPDDSAREHYERIWYELFRYNAVKVGEHASISGDGAWVYRFDFPAQVNPTGMTLGASHAMEIPFTFNMFAGADVAYYDRNDPAVQKLATNWSNTVIQFARTGDPNGAGLPQWNRYTSESRNTLVLNAIPKLLGDFDQKDRERWQAVGL
jgi:para-nitrobenzyl esterase